MDELSRKFRSIDWKSLQKQARKVQASTASALKDMVMTDLENKTRAATADTSWGASGADLMSIAHGTYRREDYALIMSIVWQRLASSRRRCVYKALELLKFLIMHGASRCTDEARAALPHLRALTEYMATDEHGQDVGEGVRKRSALVCQMLADEQVLEQERAHSREMRAKLQGGADAPGGRIGGLSSDDYRFGNSQQGYGHGHGHSSTTGTGTGTGTGFGGTAAFKGYGDDDENENVNNDYSSTPYDDVPNGQFAQRAKKAAAVDDMLGGSDDTQHDNTPVQVNVHEETNDSSSTSQAVDPADDLLSDLNALTVSPAIDQQQPNVSTSTPAGSALSTSQLVLQLAAQRTAQVPLQTPQITNGQSPQLAVSTAADSEAVGTDLFLNTTRAGTTSNAVQATNGVNQSPTLTPTSPATMKGEAGKVKVLSRVTDKEKDPFADLLSSGKQSGML